MVNLSTRKSYTFRLFIALSLLLCAIFGGKAYESVCSAAWRLRKEKGIKGLWAKATVWLMDLLEAGHCYKSWLWFQKIRAGLEIDG